LEANELFSKAQYEAQFKRWGFRKNLTKDTWHSIWHIIETRKAEGRTCAVYQRNRLIVDDKVKKETSRYRDCTSYGAICSTHMLPEDVEIRDSQTMQSRSATGPEQPATMQLTFQELISEIAAPIGESTELILRGIRETSADRATLVRDVDPADALHASLLIAADIVATSDSIALDPTHLGNATSVDVDNFLDAPFFNSDQHINGIVGLDSSIHTIPESTMSLLLPTTIPNLMPNTSRALYRDSLPTISACTSQTMSLLPFRVQQELQHLTPDAVVLKQVLFILMNNLAVDEHPAFTTLFKQIKHFSNAQLEYVLRAFPEPYSFALQQSFLTLAIKADVPSIVELLLDHGLQIGHLKSANDNDPLTLACQLRRPEIIQVLLQSGADFSLILDDVIWRTSLMTKDLGEESNSRDKIHRTLELLLKAGAKVSLHTLSEARFSEDIIILDLYIEFSQVPIDLNNTRHLLEHTFDNVVKVGDPNRIGSTVQRMLGQNFLITQAKYEDTRNILQKILQWASLKGNTGLVNFFLERGLFLDTYCLCEAIRGNNEQLGHQFVQEGLDISETWEITYDRTFISPRDRRPFAGALPSGADPLLIMGINILYHVTSPLAEAVRWGREGFLRMFEEMDVWNKMCNQRQLDCLFFAAAETGNMKLMERLLDQPFRDIPTGCCTLAALGGYRDVIALLLDTNVPTDESLIGTAVATRNPELVRFFLDIPSTSRISTTASFFAARWADVSILEDLVRAGAYLDTYQWSCNVWRPYEFDMFAQISPLKEAVTLGNIEAARFLLDSGADISGNGQYRVHAFRDGKKLTPLSIAVKLNHEGFVQELLRRGAEPKDAEAFEFALSQSKSLFEILLGAFRRRYPRDDMDFAKR
jgi:ankyrin repeat protein